MDLKPNETTEMHPKPVNHKQTPKRSIPGRAYPRMLLKDAFIVHFAAYL